MRGLPGGLRWLSCWRRPSEDVRCLDYAHHSLYDVPCEVFAFERTLEELVLDSNRIKDLPRPLFHCQELRRLLMCDNDIMAIPPAISYLTQLNVLDASRNALVDLPDELNACKRLSVVNVSGNPLGRVPEGVTQLVALTELYLNEADLEFLPANFGRLSRLRVLELRGNRLSTLPTALSRLQQLQRLDIGHNEFHAWPDVVGRLLELTELWSDLNELPALPSWIGNLRQLVSLDASNNRIRTIAPEIASCAQLEDLRLSYNELVRLPYTLGRLKKLTTLKLDHNYLDQIPETIGEADSLEELVVSHNNLDLITPCIGFLRKLQVLDLDDNQLSEIPAELGSCRALTVLSLRRNRLRVIPPELGHLPHIRVLNLAENELQWLPVSVLNLTSLQALWLSDTQSAPLVQLHKEYDVVQRCRVLTCLLLPQAPWSEAPAPQPDSEDTPRTCGLARRSACIRFSQDLDAMDEPGVLLRAPTPYPKELRRLARQARMAARAQADHARAQELANAQFVQGPLPSDNSSTANIREAKVSRPHDPETLTRTNSRLQQEHAFLQQNSAVLSRTSNNLLQNEDYPALSRSNSTSQHDAVIYSRTSNVLQDPFMMSLNNSSLSEVISSDQDQHGKQSREDHNVLHRDGVALLKTNSVLKQESAVLNQDPVYLSRTNSVLHQETNNVGNMEEVIQSPAKALQRERGVLTETLNESRDVYHRETQEAVRESAYGSCQQFIATKNEESIVELTGTAASNLTDGHPSSNEHAPSGGDESAPCRQEPIKNETPADSVVTSKAGGGGGGGDSLSPAQVQVQEDAGGSPLQHASRIRAIECCIPPLLLESRDSSEQGTVCSTQHENVCNAAATNIASERAENNQDNFSPNRTSKPRFPQEIEHNSPSNRLYQHESVQESRDVSNGVFRQEEQQREMFGGVDTEPGQGERNQPDHVNCVSPGLDAAARNNSITRHEQALVASGDNVRQQLSCNNGAPHQIPGHRVLHTNQLAGQSEGDGIRVSENHGFAMGCHIQVQPLPPPQQNQAGESIYRSANHPVYGYTPRIDSAAYAYYHPQQHYVVSEDRSGVDVSPHHQHNVIYSHEEPAASMYYGPEAIPGSSHHEFQYRGGGSTPALQCGYGRVSDPQQHSYAGDTPRRLPVPAGDSGVSGSDHENNHRAQFMPRRTGSFKSSPQGVSTNRDNIAQLNRLQQNSCPRRTTPSHEPFRSAFQDVSLQSRGYNQQTPQNCSRPEVVQYGFTTQQDPFYHRGFRIEHAVPNSMIVRPPIVVRASLAKCLDDSAVIGPDRVYDHYQHGSGF